MKLKTLSLILLLALIFLSCASTTLDSIHPDGFFSGLWHGYISLFSIIGKYIFGMNINVTALFKSEYYYWFGFIAGIILFLMSFSILGAIFDS